MAVLSLTVAGLAFVLGFRTRETIPAATADTTQPTADSVAEPTSTTTGGDMGTTTGAPTTTQATTTAGAVEADGTTVETRYGPVQVAVVVQDGHLVQVTALQLPGGNSESNAINSYAEPRLEEMALEAQSAQIDVVSGATFTSRAYAESLQAALDAAGM